MVLQVKFKKKVEEFGGTTSFLNPHFVLHLKALCMKSLHLNHEMDIVARTVDYILPSALNHCVSAALLEEAECEFGEIICQSNVRCLCMQVSPETFILFVTRGPMIYGEERQKSLCNTSPLPLNQ